eukprot:2631142-Alexandrium_andersonii.AAC.1
MSGAGQVGVPEGEAAARSVGHVEALRPNRRGLDVPDPPAGGVEERAPRHRGDQVARVLDNVLEVGTDPADGRLVPPNGVEECLSGRSQPVLGRRDRATIRPSVVHENLVGEGAVDVVPEMAAWP